jgi:phosphomannomutase/phosphoglucomutase
MNPQIFREYDIRGIADQDLCDEVVFNIGKAYGTYIQEKGIREILIGRDVRLSSDRIRNTLVDALLSSGCDVIDLGILPTPVFYFANFYYDKNAGMMITGSHNPKEFNGFKIALNKSTIYGPEIQQIRKIIEHGKYKSGAGRLSFINPIPDYINHILKRISIKSGLRVVFDSGNGTAGLVIEELFNRLGVEPVFINLEPDGNFPAHLPDPTIPEYMKDLSATVKEMDADLGIGYDGDADRIGAVDEEGEIVWGDKLLAIFAEDILKRYPRAKFVCEVKCSEGLVEFIKQLGGELIMSKTGHSLIKAKMKETGALLAGEMSGHMFFADNYFGYDDAIYASVRLIKIIADQGISLRTLVLRIPSYYSTPEIRLACPDELKFKITEEIKNYFQKNHYRVLDIDGARVNFGDGWGLIRASNTQPVLVLRFEAKTEKRLQEIQELFYDQLKKYLKIEDCSFTNG